MNILIALSTLQTTLIPAMTSLPLVLVIAFLVAGVAVVIAGSEWLVDGASAIARKSGLSEFLIGLTIVGIGTSTPELVVSWLGAARASSDIAIGNVIGSNIFNTFLILGLTAIILPMEITRENIHRDIPLNIASVLVLALLGMNRSIFGLGEDVLSRADGVLMLCLFAAYMFICFKSGADGGEAAADNAGPHMSNFKAVLLVVLGLAALIAGGRVFVDAACETAHRLGLSEKFIGITILAFGTSLPELATCIVAAAKKKGQLALGNIIGSNIANIFLILGGASLIRPLPFGNITSVDIGFLLLASLFILASYFSFSRRRLDRAEGGVMVALFGVYMYLLISTI